MNNYKPNIYKTGYNLVTSLDYNNPEKSIDKAIKVLKRSLKADNTLLFKKNEKGQFDLISASDDLYSSELKHIIGIYNKRRKRDFDVELNDKKIKRLLVLNIPIDNKLYALAVTNGFSLNDNKESINILKKSIRNIIVYSELINQLRVSNITDKITSVRNRTCFEQDLLELNKKENKIITFIMADLYRLKHINDTYGHEKGDKYIIETAHILKDIFDDDKSKVYRLGGDEFAVILDKYNIIELEEKLNLAKEKVSNINLEIDADTILNYGVASGYASDINYLSKEADESLSSNKKLIYSLKRVDRRK